MKEKIARSPIHMVTLGTIDLVRGSDMAYKLRIVLVEDEAGEELEFTEREFGEDKEKAEAAYSDSAADMLCMD